MLKLCLCLAVLILPAQSDSSAFYIERTEVYSDYGSIYILKLANQIVPPDELSRQSDIDCLIKEVKESGLFSDAHTELVREGKANRRRLIVTATPHPQLPSMVISEIALVGFPAVDRVRVQQAFDKNDVNAGEPLTRYSLNELMERITDAVREVYLNGLDNNDMENPWITLKPAGDGKVKLTVSPAYSGCDAATK
jgi:hypothetical protein